MVGVLWDDFVGLVLGFFVVFAVGSREGRCGCNLAGLFVNFWVGLRIGLCFGGTAAVSKIGVR